MSAVFMDKIRNSKNASLSVASFVDDICEERNSRDNVLLKKEIRTGGPDNNLFLPAHKNQVPDKDMTKRDSSESGLLASNGVGDVKKVQEMMTNVLDTYFSLEDAPANEYGIKYCRWLDMNSVVKGLKKKWNGQVEKGTLLQEELDARINGVNNILNFVSGNDGEAIVKEFLNAFFGEDTDFYESWNDKFPMDVVEKYCSFENGGGILILKENFKNFGVSANCEIALEEEDDTCQKSVNRDVNVFHQAIEIDPSFKFNRFENDAMDDGILEDITKEAKEDEVRNFKKELEATLKSLMNSSVIREYLGLLVIVRKFFIGADTLKILLRGGVNCAAYSLRKNSFDEKMVPLFKIGKFYEGQEYGPYNLHNLLTMFHEMGHFVFRTIMSNCDGGLSKESDDDLDYRLFVVDDADAGDVNSGIMKSLIGLDNFDKGSAVSEQMVNELCDEIWDGEIVEPIQILGMCQYQDSVLLNSYGDFALLRAIHDVATEKEVAVYLRTSHNVNVDVNAKEYDAKNGMNTIRKFFEKVRDGLPHDKDFIKNFAQKMINFLDKFKDPKELFHLPFSEINKLGKSISAELNLDLTILTAKMFYRHITVPTWNREFEKFFADLFTIESKDLDGYVERFSKMAIPSILDDLAEFIRCPERVVNLLEKDFDEILPVSMDERTKIEKSVKNEDVTAQVDPQLIDNVA